MQSLSVDDTCIVQQASRQDTYPIPVKLREQP